MTEQKNINISLTDLLFPNIFKTFNIAIQPSKMLTAFLAIAIIFAAGKLMDLHKTVVVSGRLTNADLRISMLNGNMSWPTELHCFISYPERTDNYIKMYQARTSNPKFGVFKVFSSFCIANFNDGIVYLLQLQFGKTAVAISNCVKACVWILKYHTIYGIIFLTVSFVVMTFAGGAISRGAALHFAKDQRAGFGACIRFAKKKYISILGASTGPMILAVLLGFVIISLIGLLTNIPWAGEILLAVLFLLVLICGMLIAFAIIWSVSSANLILGGLAFENTDAFDAISRAYTYIYLRPWRFGIYTILAAFYGAVCYLFLRFFAFVMLWVSRWFLDVGLFAKVSRQPLAKIDALWPKPEYFNFLGAMDEVTRPLTQTIAGTIIQLEILVIAGLVIAFAISFYFSAGTVIYCLLRNKVDNVSLGDVFIESVQAQIE